MKCSSKYVLQFLWRHAPSEMTSKLLIRQWNFGSSEKWFFHTKYQFFQHENLLAPFYHFNSCDRLHLGVLNIWIKWNIHRKCHFHDYSFHLNFIRQIGFIHTTYAHELNGYTQIYVNKADVEYQMSNCIWQSDNAELPCKSYIHS